jgi:hypothetical protein
MEQPTILRLLRTIRQLQLLSFAAQIVMILGTALLVWKLTGKIELQYLWSSPVVVSVATAAILLFLVSRSVAWIISRNHRTNAAEVDRMYGLKNRVATYIELKESTHPFLAPLIRETSSKLDSVSALRSSGAAHGILVPAATLLVVALALLTLPYLPVPQEIASRKQEQKRIAETGKELEQFARRLEQRKTATPELKQLTNQLKELSRQLQKPAIDKADALKKLNQLQEKLNQIDTNNRQRLAEDLKKSWQDAAKADGDKPGPSADQKTAMEQLAREFEGALEGKEPSKGIETQKVNQGEFSKQDVEKLKEALKKYQEQKSQAEKMRAEMQQALDKTRKTTTAGKNSYITDSRLKDRDVEKGKGGIEDGPGTTNQDTGPSRFSTKKKEKSEYVEDRTKSEYERKYQGERTDAGKEPVFLESHWDENGDPQYTRVRNFGKQNDPGNQPGDGRNVAKQNQDESAVRKERIPASHQQIVKEYFEAIEE